MRKHRFLLIALLCWLLPSYRAQFRQEWVFDKLRDQWPALTNPQKAAICNAIGVSAGNCPQ